jgi:hypothetical protein
MAVMAEFLVRGYNVAIPEVDIGDDIFVVRDDDGDYSRIQVKTALAAPSAIGYRARYAFKFSQLENPTRPGTWYVFVNRWQEQWHSSIVSARRELYGIFTRHHIGSLNEQGILSLSLSYTTTTATCSGQDFSDYLNNWAGWPSVQHGR